MRRLSAAALTLALLGAGALAAQAPEAGARGEPAPESPAGWEWYQEINPPGWDKLPRLADFVVPPDVFDRARVDLADLRLFDDKGQPVPYALRVRRTRDEQQPLGAKEFNRVTLDDHSAQLSLDLGPTPPEHNDIAVTTGGEDFRRRLRLEGSEDGKRWSTLRKAEDDYLVHFRAGGQLVDVHAFRYPPSRFRYLRVHVFPDRSLEKDRPNITGVIVSRSIHVEGEDVTLTAQLGRREPVPGDGGPGSRWTIDLGGRVPCERLDFEVADQQFARPYRLEQADPDEQPRRLVQGEWRRRPGEGQRRLEVRLPSEVIARHLRLLVTDYRNPPLALQGVTYTAAARQVIFAPSGLAPPLRLYFGNPAAQAPRYDFAADLPADLQPAPARLTPGPVIPNPAYNPPPKSWTERYPWLVYVVLGVASLVLLGLLGVLGREAIRRHDASRTATQPG